MPRHDPKVLDRALDAARKHITESAPYLVERRQLVLRIAAGVRVYSSTASVYLRHLVSEGRLVEVTAEPGEPIRMAAEGREVDLWVGDPRPRVKTALYYTFMAARPKVGPKKSVTFVMNPSGSASITGERINLTR